ncbi:MAG: dTMP kinase [Oscillospiraceae bacterium]
MGKLLVIEGLDGSGKATQAKRLAEVLAQQGRRVRLVSFPDYESDSSRLVQMYLAGAFGKKPEDVNAYAASAFYAVDRYASWKTKWQGFYEAGGVVLADRYTTSNAVHQCSKLPEAEWPAFVAWLEDFEYGKMGIPRPDLVLCLDMEPQVSQQLLVQRYGGENKKDIHEQDLGYLQRSRKAAHWCARHLGWKLVACSPNGRPRGVEDITAQLEDAVRTAGIFEETP